MLTNKQEKTLAKWDLLILVLSMVGVVLFTTISIIVENEMRYLFILEVAVALNFFIKSVKSLKEYRKLRKVEKSAKALSFNIA